MSIRRLALWIALLPVPAQAGVFDADAYSNLLTLFNEQNATLFMNAVGSWSGYRDFEGATLPTTPLGFDAGIELSLSKLPEDLAAALSTAGLASSSALSNGLPLARIHVRKRLGPRVGLGLSGIGYGDYRILGGSLKFNVWQPEEGAAAAIRFGYMFTRVGFVTGHTIRPELVVSKALAFAEPYLALGLSVTTGVIRVENYRINNVPVTIEANGGAAALTGTLGISLRFAEVLQLALEGGYHSKGAPHLAARVGIGF